ncbi:MAG TPA: thioredoxin family protein [Saprospiraceae bacterium]|nr:thioredoxin family protein [Saprospiraceae bacterium]HMQ83138.1 thioredoxin family protein [Saprospiraceae bacterium]
MGIPILHLYNIIMAYTESKMLDLGLKAPDFKLPDTISGKHFQLADFSNAKATVIMFLCNHCPYVIHVNGEIVNLAKEYQARGVKFVGISSNDAEKYPQDGPDKMKEHALAVGYPFPYLYDESQEVARAYDAACTPDFYVFDAEMYLVYRGRLDGSRPGNSLPLSGADLRAALDAVLSGQPVSDIQYPSGGCNIKWKAA